MAKSKPKGKPKDDPYSFNFGYNVPGVKKPKKSKSNRKQGGGS